MRKSDFSDLHYAGGGAFSAPGPWQHGARIIPSCELILVTKGWVYLQEGEHRYSLREGDYLVLHPGIPHTGWKPSFGPTAFYWIHFTLRHLPTELALPCTGRLQEPGALIQLARQLLHIAEDPAYPAGTADAMLYVLLAELLVQRAPRPPAGRLCRPYPRVYPFSFLCAPDGAVGGGRLWLPSRSPVPGIEGLLRQNAAAGYRERADETGAAAAAGHRENRPAGGAGVGV